MFPLLKSPWMMPAWWAAWSPSAICAIRREGVGRWKAAAGLDPLLERLSCDQLHREHGERRAAVRELVRADLEHPAHVGVGDFACKLDLFPDVPDEGRSVREVGAQRLYRNRFNKKLVVRFIDLSHASPAQEPDNSISSEHQVAGFECGVSRFLQKAVGVVQLGEQASRPPAPVPDRRNRRFRQWWRVDPGRLRELTQKYS